MATQLKETASIKNSPPMAGRATLTEEPIKGVRNEPKAERYNTTLLTSLKLIRWQSTPPCYKHDELGPLT
ncbi:MAG: hypothetical protein ACP5K1_05865, partial [Candidatus Bathyarchaeia archaeon]